MRSIALVAASSFLLVGCSSSTTTDATDAAVDGPAPLCATDPRGQTFTPGMLQRGEQSLFSMKLASMTPAPIAKGDNAWEVVLIDAAGKPVDGATITLTPYMPDHRHRASIVPTITRGDAGSGGYHVAHVVPFMPGIWTFTFDVGVGDTKDSIVFSFCVRE